MQYKLFEYNSLYLSNTEKTYLTELSFQIESVKTLKATDLINSLR